MAAKKITKWRVTFTGCRSEREAEALIRHVDPELDGTITEHDRFVCPHCGKPWPTFGSMPQAGYQYKGNVERYGATYCCDATRRDCKSE